MDVGEDEHQEVFRGHLPECLSHLEQQYDAVMPRGSKGARQIRAPLADFCGVGVPCITNWCRGQGGEPSGEHYIKIMCALELLGYHVVEWRRTPQTRRYFSELIGYGLLSLEEATQIVGYSKQTTLFAMIRQHQGVSARKEQIMGHTQ